MLILVMLNNTKGMQSAKLRGECLLGKQKWFLQQTKWKGENRDRKRGKSKRLKETCNVWMEFWFKLQKNLC